MISSRIRKMLAGNAAFARMAGCIAAPLMAFLCCAVFMLCVGINPLPVYWKLAEGVLLNPYGLAQALFRATPLVMTGLAAAVAFRTGIFNIGMEGQMLMGGFACAVAAAGLKGLPWIVHVPLCIAAAMAGGALWALLPAVLKVRRGAHEVITTIMMNFIAAALSNYMVAYWFRAGDSAHTAMGEASSFLPRLDAAFAVFKGSSANVSFAIALLACWAVGHLLWKTALGYELRAVGLSPDAAETAGINVPSRIMAAFMISDALAGLASVNFVMGNRHYFEEGFTAGAGFMGIAVALIGQNSPLGVIAAALFFGALSHGTLVINALVPKDLALIMQALVIIFVIVFDGLFRRYAKERFGDNP